MVSPHSYTDDQLTPWYPAEIKPKRKGVYERDMTHGRGSYSYWNGKYWCGWGGDVGIAHYNGIKHHESCVQDAPWRGLASSRRATGGRS